MLDKIKGKWEELTPEKKRKVVIGLAITLVFIGLIGIFTGKNKNIKKENVKENKSQQAEVDIDLLNKVKQLETQKAIEELKRANEGLKKKLEDFEKEKLKETAKSEERQNKLSDSKITEENVKLLIPPSPTKLTYQMPERHIPQNTNVPVEKQVVVLSGIEVVAEKVSEEPSVKKTEVVKAEDSKKKYYLPPSFMMATLLSGLDAPAVAKGEGNPVPVLLKVNAPAVLPNRVKANLRGCFVIAEGLGNLASERADLRLVSLSCIDKRGRAVIDQKVKGFVVDTDGKIGLRGRVVSKMGTVLARALLAGFVSGFGNALAAQSQNISITPEGSVNTIEPSKAAQYGMGSGIQMAANELLRFYMELARQTIPVVEVLPTRSVTLVISEGIDLTIKDIDY